MSGFVDMLLKVPVYVLVGMAVVVVLVILVTRR